MGGVRRGYAPYIYICGLRPISHHKKLPHHFLGERGLGTRPYGESDSGIQKLQKPQNVTQNNHKPDFLCFLFPQHSLCVGLLFSRPWAQTRTMQENGFAHTLLQPEPLLLLLLLLLERPNGRCRRTGNFGEIYFFKIFSLLTNSLTRFSI